jgi:hypothetical protein
MRRTRDLASPTPGRLITYTAQVADSAIVNATSPISPLIARRRPRWRAGGRSPGVRAVGSSRRAFSSRVRILLIAPEILLIRHECLVKKPPAPRLCSGSPQRSGWPARSASRGFPRSSARGRYASATTRRLESVMRAATRCAAVAVLLGSTIVAATAFASSPAKLRRCGYAHSRYWGRVAVYPWHLSCRAARRTLTKSESRHDRIINFTADGAYTFDAAAVKIAGRWWVCGGRMGYYFCGYPYRPARARGVGGGTTYKGPFTKELVDEACANGSSLCKRRAQPFQPPRSYR